MELICELERNILGKETCEGPSDLGEVRDEPSIEPGMAKEASDSFHIGGSCSMTSIIALSTPIPLSDTKCPKTMPSRTMN